MPSDDTSMYPATAIARQPH